MISHLEENWGLEDIDFVPKACVIDKKKIKILIYGISIISTPPPKIRQNKETTVKFRLYSTPYNETFSATNVRYFLHLPQERRIIIRDLLR